MSKADRARPEDEMHSDDGQEQMESNRELSDEELEQAAGGEDGWGGGTGTPGGGTGGGS